MKKKGGAGVGVGVITGQTGRNNNDDNNNNNNNDNNNNRIDSWQHPNV